MVCELVAADFQHTCERLASELQATGKHDELTAKIEQLEAVAAANMIAKASTSGRDDSGRAEGSFRLQGRTASVSGKI